MKLIYFISFLLLPFISMGQFSLVMNPPPVYATWNPSDMGSNIVLTNGNLSATITSAITMVRSNIGKNIGKWYWEITIGPIFNSTSDAVGIAYSAASLAQYSGENIYSWGIFDASASLLSGAYLYGGAYPSSAGSGYLNYASGDILGFALDMNAGTLSVTKNNVAMGSQITGLSGTIYATVSSGGYSESFTANFGATPFAGTVPVGFNAGLF